MHTNIAQKSSVAFFILLVLFWFVLLVTKTQSGFYNYLYSFLFGLIPLIGGMYALFRARMWGGIKSSIGRAVIFIGLGIFLWGYGETIWSYYNFFLNVAAPYPSIADFGFAPSIIFYGIGAIFLSQATGAKYALRSKTAKVFAIIAPIVIAVLSYYVLVVVSRAGVVVSDGDNLIKSILDIIYPLGDFFSLTLAVVISGLSFRYLGGKYKYDIFSILLGLGVMFIADSIFSYTTTIGTYYNADFGDLMLALGMFLLTYGILGFTKAKSLSGKVKNT
jgi:hypothetical protein